MSKHRHFLLYKPAGYLSQFITNQSKRKNKKLLGALFDFPSGTMAVGRLDEYSEGLLILTTDGKLSDLIRSKKVEKEYYVQVDGIVNPHAIEQLKKGVDISINGKRYKTLPCQAKKLDQTPDIELSGKKIRSDRHGPTSWLSVTITEGKFRQVRKMTAAVGFPTLRLLRVRIGNFMLHDMSPGEVRELTQISINEHT